MSKSTSRPVKINELARILGRRFGTVCHWREKGHLVPCGKVQSGPRALKRFAQLFDIEAARKVSERFPVAGSPLAMATCPTGHLTTLAVAGRLGVHECNVRKWFDKGELAGKTANSGRRVARFVSEDSLAAFMLTTHGKTVATKLARRQALFAGGPTAADSGELRTVCPIQLLKTASGLLSPLDDAELRRRREKFASRQAA